MIFSWNFLFHAPQGPPPGPSPLGSLCISFLKFFKTSNRRHKIRVLEKRWPGAAACWPPAGRRRSPGVVLVAGRSATRVVPDRPGRTGPGRAGPGLAPPRARARRQIYFYFLLRNLPPPGNHLENLFLLSRKRAAACVHRSSRHARLVLISGFPRLAALRFAFRIAKYP